VSIVYKFSVALLLQEKMAEITSGWPFFIAIYCRTYDYSSYAVGASLAQPVKTNKYHKYS
jgi:hypothetical protein